MPAPGQALTIGLAAESVRETSPVVHCIAPLGATPFVADVLYGVGATSVLTGTAAGALEALRGADAVSLDFATLAAEWSDAVVTSVAAVTDAGVPWVLDLSPLGRVAPRVDRARALLAHRPAVLLSTDGRLDGAPLVLEGAAMALGDPVERVMCGGQQCGVGHGAELLRQVPGVRSAIAALIAACASVTGHGEAALAGSAWLALASERAAEHAHGPASFRSALVDALARVRGDEIARFLVAH